MPSRFAMALVASVLLLSGCAVARPLPPAPSRDEIAKFIAHSQVGDGVLSSLVASSGGSDRPDIHIVYPDNADISFAECMNESGFANYWIDYFGTLVLSVPNQFRAQAATVAGGKCRDAYRTVSLRSSILSTQERAYVYDYYESWLVPCLRSSGFQLNLAAAPTRTQFIADWLKPGWWSPYLVIDPVLDNSQLARAEKTCPALPPELSARLSS